MRVLLVVALLGSSASVTAQTPSPSPDSRLSDQRCSAPTIARLSLEPARGAIKFRYSFKDDVSQFADARLSYGKDVAGPSPTLAPDARSATEMVFALPFGALEDWDSVETGLSLGVDNKSAPCRYSVLAFNIAYLRSLVSSSVDTSNRDKEVVELKEEIKELKDAQAGLKRLVQATDLRPGTPPFQTDQRLVFHFVVKGYGVVQGQLRDESNRIVDTETSALSDHPYLVFESGLTPGNQYTVSARLLSIQTGSPIGSTVSIDGKLEKKTALSKLSIVEDRSDDNAVKLRLTADASGYYRLQYREQITTARDDKTTVTAYGPNQTVGGYDNNQINGPSGAKIGPDAPVDIDLPRGKSERTFLITPEAIDEQGSNMVLDLPPGIRSRSVSVPPLPQPPIRLDFENTIPIVAEYTPAGVRLTWKATRFPEEGAKAVLSSDLPGAPPVPFQATVSPELKGEATVPVDKYIAFIEAITGKPVTDAAAKDSKTPAPKPQNATITISMTGKGGVVASRALQFGFVISKDTVNEAAAKHLINTDTQAALLQIIKDASNGNSVDWKKVNVGKLITTGLGVLFKII